MRALALAAGLGSIGCGDASPRQFQTDGGQPVVDAAAACDGGSNVGRGDGGTETDGGNKMDDGGDAADPLRCDTVGPLVLSNPIVSSGTVTAGQMVTLQITLIDTDPNGYVSYPGAVITSSTAGVTFAANVGGPPGSYIDGTASKPITFQVTFDSSIPRGTEVDFSARAYGWGHQAPDCNGFVLSFSLTTS